MRVISCSVNLRGAISRRIDKGEVRRLCKSDAENRSWLAILVMVGLAGNLSAQTLAGVTSPLALSGSGRAMIKTHKRSLPALPSTEHLQTGDFNSEQGPGAGPIGPGPGCNVFPASANIGTNIGLSYFGPPPSTDNPSLVGPEQLLKSGTIDATNGTITLPLYLGYMAKTNKKV